MSCLMESTTFKKLHCFLQIIYIHADHRPFVFAFCNIHMESVSILHTDIRPVVDADSLFRMLLFKAQILK